MTILATWGDFEEEVLKAENPVVALFHASWCSFCRAYLPDFRGSKANGVKLVEVDISSESSPFWDAYGIEITPTLILFHEGKVAGRADGRSLRGLEKGDLERLLQLARENKR
ncbi:MAG: thioredoxin family protein [Thermoplasmata archaeon]